MNGTTYVVFVINALITAVVGAMCVAVWLANRKRLAAETVGRAEEQASRLIKDAERDADTLKKEALLEAKERAHASLVEADWGLGGHCRQAGECDEEGREPRAPIEERRHASCRNCRRFRRG